MSSKELEMKAREHDITDANAQVVTEAAEAVAKEVTTGYKKMENGVVTGYKKIETGVVEGFNGIAEKMSGVMLDEEGKLKTGKVGEAVVGAYKKVENAFVSTFLTKEGESLEDAKARLAEEAKARNAKMKADQEARQAAQKEMIEKSLEARCKAGKRN